MYNKHEARLSWAWVILSAAAALALVLIAIFAVDAPAVDHDAQTQASAGRGLGREVCGVQLSLCAQTLKNDPLNRVTADPLAQDETERKGFHAPEPVAQTLPVEVEPVVEPEIVEESAAQYDSDAVMIAKTIAVEAPYCSTMEQAAVAWTILNRVDDPRFPSTVAGNVTPTNPRQFGYYPWTPLRDDLYALALDVLSRWELEKNGEVDVGRVLPREYLYFWGDGVHNHFRVNERDRVYWDWSAPNPYE